MQRICLFFGTFIAILSLLCSRRRGFCSEIVWPHGGRGHRVFALYLHRRGIHCHHSRTSAHGTHPAAFCACSAPGLAEALRVVGYLRKPFGSGMSIGTTIAGRSGVTVSGNARHTQQLRIFRDSDSKQRGRWRVALAGFEPALTGLRAGRPIHLTTRSPRL